MTETPTDVFTLSRDELPAALEAVLFASGDPVSLDRICEITGTDNETALEALRRLTDRYNEDPRSGISVRRLENDYVMCTKPGMKSILERLFRPRSRPPMSQATYETLAVIAYNQPVTRAQVESVRGVSSDSIISRLLERGWIQECGTLDAPGRPVLFETTQQFLMEFGIESVAEMPAMDLMMYSTIRDLEKSLEEAAGARDNRQVSIEHLPSDPDYPDMGHL
ncbi:MAG: SMC-Scp complex subunit ScpB [Oscillospiraceae bacterium]|nr:SMC-Scp complex subunit ScpB [Oscillospiraceae bacterium]